MCRSRFCILVALGLLVPVLPGATLPPRPVLRFAGHTWLVKQGTTGPGPNAWDPANAWVDAAGRLHLRITARAGRWTCAEIVSEERFGAGRYRFDVVAPLDRLDPNVVLGLFQYPPPDVGPDGAHEVDVELTRWGDPARPFVHYAAYPARPGLPSTAARGEVLAGTHTTHVFTRTRGHVTFESLHGHGATARAFHGGPVVLPAGSDAAMPVHLNLWLDRGQPPTDGQEMEVIVADFAFEPLAAPDALVLSSD